MAVYLHNYQGNTANDFYIVNYAVNYLQLSSSRSQQLSSDATSPVQSTHHQPSPILPLPTPIAPGKYLHQPSIPFPGTTPCKALTYSQYSGYQPHTSQFRIPVTSTRDDDNVPLVVGVMETIIFRGCRAPCVRTVSWLPLVSM